MGISGIRVILLVLVAIPSLGLVSAQTTCELCLDDVCYEKNILFDSLGLSTARQVTIDRTDNNVYFVDKNGGALKSYNLANNTMRTIRESGIFGIAVDQKTQDLYINNQPRILKYNPVTDTTTVIYLNRRLEELYFKDKLYGILASYPRLYQVEEGKVKNFPPISSNFNDVRNLIIDKRGDFYFRQPLLKTYKLSAATNSTSLFSDGPWYVHATDKDDVAYFIDLSDRSISRMNYDTDQLVKVGKYDPAMDGLLFFYFDKNNNIVVVQGVKQNMHYLTAASRPCILSRNCTNIVIC